MSALALCLSLLQDPRIERVEFAAGDVHRPLRWAPMWVTVSSESGFVGALEADSDYNIVTAVPLKLAPGGRASVLLPALEPEHVKAGTSKVAVKRERARAERAIVVAESMEAPAGVHVSVRSLEVIEELKRSPESLSEAADRVEQRAPTDLAGVKVLPVPEAVDPGLWSLAPEAGWSGSVRSGLVYLALIGAALAMGVFAIRSVPWRRRAAGAACAAALGLGVWLVPGGALSLEVRSVRIEPDRVEIQYWFLRAGIGGVYDAQFPKLVKPVFPTAGGARAPFRLTYDGGRTNVTGLVLEAGQSMAFGTWESAAGASGNPMRDVIRVKGGVARATGPCLQPWDRAWASAAPGPEAPSREYEAFKDRVGKDGLFGIVEGEVWGGGGVRARGLGEVRKLDRILIWRKP